LCRLPRAGEIKKAIFASIALKADEGRESKSAPVVPGQPEQSELVRRLTATDEDDRMPQKDDPLPTEHIALIERWIKDGRNSTARTPKLR